MNWWVEVCIDFYVRLELVIAHALVDAHGRERKQLEMHLFADNGVGSVPGKKSSLMAKQGLNLVG